MNTAIQTEVKAPYFGARAAGVILIVALVTYIFGDYLLLRLLRHFQETAGIFSLQENNENEIMAMRSAILGVVNPALTMVVCVAMLRTYFPRESIKELFNRFGLVGRPSLKLLVAAFLGGMAYLFFFSKVLMHIFPPDPFAVPHPANIINFAPIWWKIIFAVTVVTIVPISEEFMFRGVLYQGIINSWGKFVSAICVGAVFVLLHPDTIKSGYWITHLALYLFPIFMVLIREITGALFGSIMAHSGFNFAEIFF